MQEKIEKLVETLMNDYPEVSEIKKASGGKYHVTVDLITRTVTSPEFDEMDRAYLKFTEALDEFMSAVKISTKEW